MIRVAALFYFRFVLSRLAAMYFDLMFMPTAAVTKNAVVTIPYTTHPVVVAFCIPSGKKKHQTIPRIPIVVSNVPLSIVLV